jgi:hypothetical protein
MNNFCKLVKNIDQYNEDFVYFTEPIKNNIMNDGYFIRIIYSTSSFVLNGIYISMNINYSYIDKYFTKFKCSFDIVQHKEQLDKIYNIEDGLLKKINIIGKMPQYKIYDQLKNGNIKVFSDTINKVSSTIVLKIAGIWETELEYGLTYKFMTI